MEPESLEGASGGSGSATAVPAGSAGGRGLTLYPAVYSAAEQQFAQELLDGSADTPGTAGGTFTMRKSGSSIATIMLPALITGAASAGSVSFYYRLPDGAFGLSAFETFEMVTCADGGTGFEEGQPNLPVVSLCFVIPQGTEVSGASFRIETETQLPGFHDIVPVAIVPVGELPGPFLRNAEIYLSDEVFPESPVISISSGTRTGFRLGTVAFSPFRYNPLSGRLSVVQAATLTLEYSPDSAVPCLALTEDQVLIARDILEHIVRNPGDLDAFSPPIHSPSDVVQWVAVGSAAMQPVLQPLVDFRNSQGMASQYATLEWICSSYTGYDTQEKIRNFIKDWFLHHGLMYALLVGDWGETQRISSLRIGADSLLLGETADLYFSDLTRMWDGDGDHLYGENTDWIDYYSDIAVGRFSSDNPNLVATQVEKTILYETGTPEGPWRTSALLCGAGLWPDVEPDGYWGSFICDSISNRIPPGWTQYKLYEYWDGHPTNQIDLVNTGVSYVSAQGHGASSGVYWLYEPGNMFTNQNYTGMNNWGMFPIFHSMACNPGQLSVNGCSAERLMMWPYGGAIAVGYNSNYGWGTPPAMGPSEALELHFANMLFVNGVQRIGDMQAAAKDAFKASGSMACQNWVLQENNLLGDPAALFLSYQTGTGGAEPPEPSGARIGNAFPNPASSSFSAAWSLPAPMEASIEVFDISGRMVRRFDLPGSQTEGVITVDCTEGGGAPLPSGCYLMTIRCAEGEASSRVVLLGR